MKPLSLRRARTLALETEPALPVFSGGSGSTYLPWHHTAQSRKCPVWSCSGSFRPLLALVYCPANNYTQTGPVVAAKILEQIDMASP
jgi:hypothetical protein